MRIELSPNAALVDGTIVLQKEIRAIDIAKELAKAGAKYLEPTAEQIAIIESKHWGPTVVIAGAGSGKTETMTQRVLWLVANGVVEPNQILGLTFTRKAAGELTSRVRHRLRQLRKARLLPSDPSNSQQSIDIAVEISTYHSYAGRVLSQHGIRMGIDTEGEPLGEAAAWQLFSETVAEFPETLYPLESSPNTITDAVISLSTQIAEHGQSIEAVRTHTQALLDQLDTVDPSTSNEEYRRAVRTVHERLSLLPMVEAADRKRREENLLTFDDHMSLAAQLVQSIDEVAQLERAKYRVVLLDEYQDTSQSQVRFLSALFGSHTGEAFAVTAVGDPLQAIYGWRGASADTLERFAGDFLGESSSVTAERFSLLTSWRNDQRVLDFANQIVDQISVISGAKGRVRKVDRLQLKNQAEEGRIFAGRYLTARDEAVAIASHFARLWNDPQRLKLDIEKRSSFAVLIRSKSYIPEIEAALREHGLDVEVVGLGGLIHIPEIADIIALLRTLTFPDSGTSLARLLVGPRLALGPKDLMALGRYARDITESSSQGRSRRLEDILESGDIASLENDDFAIGSIIEALDLIHSAPADKFSREGLRRLIEFSEELALLRRGLHGSITDLLIEAERFLRLDIEVLVRDGWENGRRHLDAFIDEAARFQRNGGTLGGFLRWLEVTDKREGGLKPATITVSNKAVQILTIHTAKGAEWDHIAIPGLVKGNFPSSGKKSDSWLKNSGSIPLDLRADALQFGFSFEFPRTSGSPKAVEVSKALKAFDDEWKSLRLEEEYRLAYVAFTRARHTVIATSSIYRDGAKERDLSEIYTWVKDYLTASDPSAILEDAVDDDGINPVIANPRTAQWPARSSRSEAIIESALIARTANPLDVSLLDPSQIQVSELLSSFTPADQAEAVKKAQDALSIITEIKNRRSIQPVYLPDRLSVSALLTLKSDPDSLALSLRRPMPSVSNTFAQRGTQFHQWVERYLQVATLFDDDIFDPTPVTDIPLEELKEKWLASDWAKRIPVGVEIGFETLIAGVVVKGRIDAIYENSNGTFEVIDWKTGREKSGDELSQAAIQLAVYRLAYAKLHGLDISQVSAGFHYINENSTVRPADLFDESELIALVESVPLTSH